MQRRVWLARLMVGIVLLFNLQAAILFLWRAEDYAPIFGLEGMIGAGTLRAIGILFIMWNVPYFVAMLHPVRHRTSLWEAIVMQTIGLLGESSLLFALPNLDPSIASAVIRFVIFDASALLLLLCALIIAKPPLPVQTARSMV